MYNDINRILSFIAALIVLYCEYTGSTKSDALLFGFYGEITPSNTYQSQLISSFLISLVKNPIDMKKTLISFKSTNESRVIYLDRMDTSTSYSLALSSCYDTMEVDFLYDIQYIQPTLELALDGYSLNLTHSWYIVDCTFDGRVLGDSSMIKLYHLDHEVTTFTTILIQTVLIQRNNQYRSYMGGVLNFMSTSLESFQLAFDGITLESTIPATYFLSIGFDFPYENKPFQHILLDELIPTTGLWHGTIVDTMERFTFGGIEGFYRRALTIQSAYAYYYWDLPLNSIEYITTVKYFNRNYYYDLWGWFRCLLGIGISTTLTISTLVSLLVMFNLYRQNKVIWIPDIYPSIQKIAMIRAILLFLDCLIGGWWRVYQIALNQGNYRLGLIGVGLLKEITRVDGLMVSLGITYIVSNIVRVRIHLILCVIGYIICFEYRIEFYDGFFINDTNIYLNRNFLNNLVTINNTMSLWTVYENNTTNCILVLTENTWCILSILLNLSIVYIMFIYVHLQSNKIGPSIVTVLTHRQSIVSFRLKISTHWSKRSMLYKPLDQEDDDYTSFERSVGTIVGYVFGFVASTMDYELIQSRLYVSRNGVWLLGYVVLDSKYAIEIVDYPLFLLNVITQSTLFQVYGFLLDMKTTSNHQVKIPWKDFDITRALLAVSLEPLA